MIQEYENLHKYIWRYANTLEVHINSYMCNMGLKSIYLSFNCHAYNEDFKIKTVCK